MHCDGTTNYLIELLYGKNNGNFFSKSMDNKNHDVPHLMTDTALINVLHPILQSVDVTLRFLCSTTTSV